jgi:transcriptional regulator with XRE-family HTH domain
MDNLIKTTCKRLNIKQKELATRLGVTETTMSAWATGEAPQWVKVMMELLETEKRYQEILQTISELNEKIKKI